MEDILKIKEIAVIEKNDVAVETQPNLEDEIRLLLNRNQKTKQLMAEQMAAQGIPDSLIAQILNMDISPPAP